MVKIICGLGNPGRRYSETRHNLGFEVIERLKAAVPVCASGESDSFVYDLADATTGKIALIRPTTFVNRSGWAAQEALERFGAAPEEFFVIVDDFHLPLGRIRIRASGSAGGHNGLESIIEQLGTAEFPRMRCGIGPLPEWCLEDPKRIPDFVLDRFAPEERKIVDTMNEISVNAVREMIENGLDLAISRYNNTNANPTPEQ